MNTTQVGDQLDTNMVSASEAYANQLLLMGIFFGLMRKSMSTEITNIRRPANNNFDLWLPNFTRLTLIP